VFAYPYDAAAGTVGTRKAVITNMGISFAYHTTRTLVSRLHLVSDSSPIVLHSRTLILISSKRIAKSKPDVVLVARGSSGNIDSPTTGQDSGRSQTRMFNIASILATPVDYSKAGDVLGWGLRNSVGLGEDPSTGGIWSVENSADDSKSGCVSHSVCLNKAVASFLRSFFLKLQQILIFSYISITDSKPF